MINVKVVTVGVLAENCYIVYNEGSDKAVLIDPGDNYEKLSRVLDENKLKPVAVLLTHAHFDHCNVASKFQADGCKVYVHIDDEQLIRTEMNMASGMGFRFNKFTPDVLVCDGYEIDEAGITFKVMHTPGHTGGSVCYITDNIIFSGDTLFYLDVGRCDLPTGNHKLLAKSLERIAALSGDYIIYPGHGETTTLDYERKNNPYV